MNCDAVSPRLTIVKQTYGRQHKTKSSSPPATNTLPKEPVLRPKEEPIELPPHLTSSPLTLTNPVPSTPPHNGTTSRYQFATPVSVPSCLPITPPRSVPNILRKTPTKPSGSPRVQLTKSRSVNLSPVLYSPTLKKKNPFLNDVSGGGARIITSYVVSPSKKTVMSPKKKTMSSQCNIHVSRASPQKAKVPAKALKHSGEKISCNVELKCNNLIVVSHSVNGVTYSGVLVAQPSGSSVCSQPVNGGYLAEQLPSQHRKKLKARLGLTFEGGCDSETSDTEGSRTKLTKLKYPVLKAMKNSLNGAEPGDDRTRVEDEPIQPTAVRPNVPYKSAFQYNKKSINGLADFLQEASARNAKPVTPEKNKPLKQLPSKEQTKPSPSPKKHKIEKSGVKQNCKPKPKFGEKFIKLKKAPQLPTSVAPQLPTSVAQIKLKKEDPAVIAKKLADVAQHYKMTSHSLQDTDSLQKVLSQNSSKFSYVDLDWPIWCPRKLKLAIKPVRSGKPARFKVERNTSKRRRTDSSGSDQRSKDMYTETHNPYGIGDVVVAKRVQCPGRPYWPGKVLSVTGLTVCVLFYNTSEVMQLAKCNVQWFYDGCSDHKLFYNSASDSQEWKEALEQAEGDVKGCIGLGSVVWGLFEDEWWPALIVDIQSKKYTVRWLDDNSTEPLTFDMVSPFLLAHSLRYDEAMAKEYDNYQDTVDRAQSMALSLLLETQDELSKGRS